MADLSLDIRSGLRRILPSWLQDRPALGKTTGFRYLYCPALLADAGVEAALQAVRLRYPSECDVSALPSLGRDRGMQRGPEMTDDLYRAALVEYLPLWEQAAHAYALARMVQLYLDPGHPVVRIVNRQSSWFTLAADGTFSHYQPAVANWDWDSETHPERASNWWESWVIVYEPHLADDGDWGDPGNWGDPADDGGYQAFGQSTSMQNVSAVRSFVRAFKGTHATVRSLIWSYDPTLFDPTAALGDPSLPDGWWGNWHKIDSGVAVPSRPETCRFWDLAED